MKSGERKMRRNHSCVKHSICGREKRGEQLQSRAQGRMKVQLQDCSVGQWIISHIHQAPVLLAGLFRKSSVIYEHNCHRLSTGPKHFPKFTSLHIKLLAVVLCTLLKPCSFLDLAALETYWQFPWSSALQFISIIMALSLYLLLLQHGHPQWSSPNLWEAEG